MESRDWKALGAAATLSIMLMVASRVGDMVVVLPQGVVIAALICAVVTILIFFANEQQTREFIIFLVKAGIRKCVFGLTRYD